MQHYWWGQNEMGKVLPLHSLHLFSDISPPSHDALPSHSEAASKPACAHALRYTQVHTYPVETDTVSWWKTIFLYHKVPTLPLCSHLSYPLCCGEKTSYHWGHVTSWGIEVIWIGRSAIITGIWTASCIKQHMLKVSAVTSNTFHRHSFHVRLRFSSKQPQLTVEERTVLYNRNPICTHLNCRGNALFTRGHATLQCSGKLYCGFIWTLGPLVIQLFGFTWLHSHSLRCVSTFVLAFMFWKLTVLLIEFLATYFS